jgi:hypothetical protein
VYTVRVEAEDFIPVTRRFQLGGNTGGLQLRLEHVAAVSWRFGAGQ